MPPGVEKEELGALGLDAATPLDDGMEPEVRVAEVETSVTDNEPGTVTVTDGRPDPGGILDVPFTDQEAETLPLLSTGVSVELGLPVVDVGDDSGAMAELEEFKPADVDGPPVFKEEGLTSVDDGPDGPPVGVMEPLSDSRDDGALGPEDAGGLPAGYEELPDGVLPLAGDVEPAGFEFEAEAEEPVALVKAVEAVDSGGLPVPGTEPDGLTPLLVELEEPQLVGPVPPDREDEGLPGPVDVLSLAGAELDEATVTVVASLVVRSVICVVDSLVAIVVI